MTKGCTHSPRLHTRANDREFLSSNRVLAATTARVQTRSFLLEGAPARSEIDFACSFSGLWGKARTQSLIAQVISCSEGTRRASKVKLVVQTTESALERLLDSGNARCRRKQVICARNFVRRKKRERALRQKLVHTVPACTPERTIVGFSPQTSSWLPQPRGSRLVPFLLDAPQSTRAGARGSPAIFYIFCLTGPITRPCAIGLLFTTLVGVPAPRTGQFQFGAFSGTHDIDSGCVESRTPAWTQFFALQSATLVTLVDPGAVPEQLKTSHGERAT